MKSHARLGLRLPKRYQRPIVEYVAPGPLGWWGWYQIKCPLCPWMLMQSEQSVYPFGMQLEYDYHHWACHE